METLNLIKNDPWLEPYADAINGRHKHAAEKEAELTNKGKQTLSDFASGYLYFGLLILDNPVGPCRDTFAATAVPMYH